MNRDELIKKTPFLYHLTDEKNIAFIKAKKKLYSTTELISLSNLQKKEEFITTRRSEHTQISIDGYTIFIRDQRPLNKALDKCLTDGWTRNEFIAHLNNRVFMWPNLSRLNIHYGRYEFEMPVIFRFNTSELLELNENKVELARINSGATRPSGTLGGKAAARGKNTFLKIEQCDYPVRNVAEVTFPNICILPNRFEKGYNPSGPWDEFIL